jgi:hypothetical protein
MTSPPQIDAFIDSAFLHGAFAAFAVGGPAHNWAEWDLQSLLECTHLLLFSNVGLAPGPTHLGVAVYGHESKVAESFPQLIVRRPDISAAVRNTRLWLSRCPGALRHAWDDLSKDPKQLLWSDLRRRLFWEQHIRSNDGLFEPQYLPNIASTLSEHVTVAELQRIHSLSKIPAVVRYWARQKDRLEEACQIANMAYIVSSLIRGKHHEYVARHAHLQLIAHPHRKYVAGRTQRPHEVPIANSQQAFVKMIIGSDLLETREEHRRDEWIKYILRARALIAVDRLDLRHNINPEVAENRARDAARSIGLRGTAPWKEYVLTWTVTSNVMSWLTVFLGPWAGLLGGAGLTACRVFRKRGIGEDLVLLGTTKRDYARLASAVPGRIDRALVPDKGVNP